MTDRHPGTPEWVQPGAEAILLRSAGSRLAPPRLTEVTVERVLKRDVVLSNDERVTQPDLRRYEGGAWDSTLYELLQPDDPKVDEARREIRRREIQNATQRIAHDLNQSIQQARTLGASFQTIQQARNDLYELIEGLVDEYVEQTHA